MQGSIGPRHVLPRSTGDVVSQMNSFVSYMEDLKSSKDKDLEPHKGKLRELAKRLSELAGEEGGNKKESG